MFTERRGGRTGKSAAQCMKKVWAVFKHDLESIFNNVFATIIFVGIIFIPALYAWFNINSNWNPYGNTKGIKIAVANTDEGDQVEGLTMNIGGMIVDELSKNDQIGWQFVSKDDTMAGVESGAYYAAIIIPENFSKSILSITELTVETPKIEYYVNEKKNAIAPKITDSGVNTLQSEVNSTFIETVTSVLSNVMISLDKDLQGNETLIVDNVVSDLETVKKDLENFKNLTGAVTNASNSLTSALDATRALLPQATAGLDSASQLGTDTKSLIGSTQNAASQLSSTAQSSLSMIQQSVSGLDREFSNATATVESDSKNAAGQIDSLKNKVSGIRSQVTGVRDALQPVQSQLPQPLSGLDDLISRLGSQIEKLQNAENLLSDASSTVTRTGKIPSDMQSEIQSSLSQINSDMGQINTTFTTQTKPALDGLFSSLNQELDSLSGLMTSVSGLAPGLDSALGSIGDSMGYANDALDQTGKVMDDAIGKIDQFINELNNARDGEKIKKLVELVTRDPDVIASFMKEPVTIETESLYPIKNYGSGMAPFYSTLAIWVGALVNVAILKVHVKDPARFGGLTPDQAYFGRYMLFGFVSILQAVVICLGDIFILQIQCLHPFLFVLIGIVAGITYSLLMYTLTVAFGDVGKAIAVIIMVIQVAGSGGTFPIETLPDFYQKLYPWYPFNYSINAMRECVAGLYANDYWIYMVKEMCFIPFSLLIGLVLRKPIMRLTKYVEHSVEDTGIMG